MDISVLISNGVVILGFIITGWFQKKRIDSLKENVSSLEKTISAQERALNAMEKAAQIIDIDKYQKHIKTYEELVEKNSKLALEVREKEMNARFIGEKTKSINAIETLINLYFDLSKFIFISFLYIHPDEREQLINNFKFPEHKEIIANHLKDIKDKWIYPSKYTLFFALSEFKASKN